MPIPIRQHTCHAFGRAAKIICATECSGASLAKACVDSIATLAPAQLWAALCNSALRSSETPPAVAPCNNALPCSGALRLCQQPHPSAALRTKFRPAAAPCATLCPDLQRNTLQQHPAVRTAIAFSCLGRDRDTVSSASHMCNVQADVPQRHCADQSADLIFRSE